MKTLKKSTPTSIFKVWNPRWHDRKALLINFRLGFHNEITFPKSNALPDVYYISGEKANRYPTEYINNKFGKPVLFRVIPIDDLETLRRVDE